MNNYYDIKLKHSRLEILENHSNFTFIKGDLENYNEIVKVFEIHRPEIVVHLAAQAGVRYSIENPVVYMNSNMMGFFHILEACRTYPIEHLLYASSSSVYGNQEKTPFSTTDNVNHPVSFYAATKKSNELMAHSYSHLYDIPTTGLRFFTIYGSYGRPDMAYFSFTKKIINYESIKIFNNGDMYRDFTYIDDAIQAIENIIKSSFKSLDGSIPYKLYNIGNNTPVKLMYFIETLEKEIGITAIKEYMPMQAGDVYQTYADVNELIKSYNFKPCTTIEEGLKKFVSWYKSFYIETGEAGDIKKSI